MEKVGKLHAAVMALIMILVLRPSAEDGALHAKRAGSHGESWQIASGCYGAEHDLGGPTFWPQYNYKVDNGNPLPNKLSAARTRPQYMVCEEGGNILRNSHHVPSEMDTMACYQYQGLCESFIMQNMFAPAYDTIRYFLRHCAAVANQFGFIDLINLYNPGTPQLKTSAGHLELRHWLLDSILPLRRDDLWFCWCVYALRGGFDFGDYRAQRSIFKYLLDNSRCLSDTGIWASEYRYASEEQWIAFQDTIKSHNEVYDSSLLSMHDLGLDSVLKYAGMRESVYDETAAHNIDLISLVENPTNSIAELKLRVDHEEYLSVELFDLLGRKMSIAGFDGVIPPGSKLIPIDMSALPSGTYYARIVTAYGETRTVKIVKN